MACVSRFLSVSYLPDCVEVLDILCYCLLI